MSNKKRGVSSPSVSPAKRGLDLPRARQRNGVRLDAVAARTKISMRYLEAIEAEQFGELPGGIFTINYLRQYAEAAGFDADRLIRHYRESERKEAPAEPASRPVARGLLERLLT